MPESFTSPCRPGRFTQFQGKVGHTSAPRGSHEAHLCNRKTEKAQEAPSVDSREGVGSVTDLEQLTEIIKSGKRPDLRDLGVAIQHSLKEVDVMEWTAFEEVVTRAYKISEDELYSNLLPPMFTRLGGYVDDFSPLLDKCRLKGWLRRYVEHTRMSESPTAFHFAPALAVLASSLHRQVWIDQGIYQIWPATQVMLLGPSAWTHKSTAANYAVKLGEVSGRVNRLMDEGSQEGLKRELSTICKKTGSATGLLYASELAALLNKSEYNVGMVQAITDLFDSRDGLSRVLVGKTSKLKNIALSAIWCSNEEAATASIPISAFGGGLMSRMLVWFQPGTDRSFAQPGKAMKAAKRDRDREFKALRDMLAKTGIINGEFELDSKASKWFDKRYEQIRASHMEDERMDPMWGRYPDHMLRMAMLLSVSEMLESAYEGKTLLAKAPRTIQVSHLRQADGILRWVLRYLPKVYAFLGMTAFGVEATRILQFIARKGGRVSEREIGRKMRISKRNLDEHLDTLKSYGHVHPEKSQIGKEWVLDRNPWEA